MPPHPLLEPLLRLTLERGASDLHLCPGLPPVVRLQGELQRLPQPPLATADVLALLQPLMGHEQCLGFDVGHDQDFCLDLPGLGRFRVNLYRQRMGAAAALRAIPPDVPTLDGLQAPPVLGELALLARGLVLCSGPTGSGKSTTLAALVHHRLQCRGDHILTLEDPIEFVHDSSFGLVTQREIGVHAPSFEAGLRSALREDPDVILVGELRDAATIGLALTAAETGHLVLATVHASGAAATVDRVVDAFSGDEKDTVRALLAQALQAVVSQTLCRRSDGQGRTAAVEVLRATPAARSLIRENKAGQLVSVMQSGLSHGMQTLDQHLGMLVRQGRITAQEAKLHAHYPENFR